MRPTPISSLKPWLAAAGLALAPLSVNAAEPHHVHIAVSSPSVAVTWYLEHLDCEPIANRPETVFCGGVEIEFLERTTLGGSQGTGVNHIAFSYPDVEAAMKEFEGVGVRGSGVRLQRFADGSTLQEIPGIYLHGFIFDPWGTRIELVQDPDHTGFHHLHLSSSDPEAALDWYEAVFSGERDKLMGQQDGVRFGDVWLLADKAETRPAATSERAIDHIAFSLADLDAAAEHMAANSAAIEPSVPENARSDAKRAFLLGPDGVGIAVVEPGWAGIERADLMVADSDSDEHFVAPRTPWGEPDLQGMWTGNAAHGIPLERPADVEAGEELTAEQAAARRERGTLGSIWGYEREWRDTTLGYVKSAPSTQVAMVIDPPDGRLPALTDKGQERADKARAARVYRALAAGPEDLSTYVRCITRGLPGMMMPSIYNNGLQIQQSPGYVAVQKEMIHETRIIPISDRPRSGLKQWLGSARGHWEGDTLVVETRDFNGRAMYMGSDENLTLIERYRRIGPDTLEYTFTVDDPTIWTAPWTGRFNFGLDNDQYELVEYACHEGNYGMTNILSGARAKEKELAEADKL